MADPYDLDPDVAILRKRSAASQIPTKTNPLFGQNKQFQPDAEYDYNSDPDVAILTNRVAKNPEEPTTGFLPSWLAGGIEATMGAISSAATPIVGGAYGIAKSIPEAIRTGQPPQPIAQRYAEQFIKQHPGYTPRTEEGQQYLSEVGKAFEAAHLPPIMPEALAMRTERRIAGMAGENAANQLKNQFSNVQKPTLRVEPALQSGGAAAAVPENVLRGSVDAALTNASPELQAHIQSRPLQSVNVSALETRALEEKHGVNLTKGQRTGDTQLYSQEWNKRGETEALGGHFNEQPTQISNAFEVSKQRHAPDIPSTADASELGQNTINALAAKDQVRTQAISNAYKALEEANGGQFPIDVSTLDSNIKQNLASKLKTSHLSSAIASDLQDFYANPTFEAYEALRTNLANEMRSNGNGNARAAAYIVRQELENLPVFGEGTGSPQAMQLKALADNARKLVRERAEVLKSNPAYRAAVKEAGTLEEAASQGESLNAEKFHKKYVANATPEAIRRMKAEIADDNLANQSIAFSELERAKNAAVNASGRNLTPEQFAKFYKQNKSILRETLSPEALQDVTEIGLLTSKIGMPKTGTFNYSNTYSGMLADMAKQGLAGAGEAKLAAMTGGASIPAVHLGKQWMQKLNKEGFAKEALNPYGGLTKA
jgi:hypothetical protein